MQIPVAYGNAVTLVGAAPFHAGALAAARAIAPVLVAADGGADTLAARGVLPDLVVGDLDSLADPALWRSGPSRLLPIAEQDTTDFEKCLYATRAPFYLATGFTGGRLDHTLAVLHALLRYPDKTVIVLGEDDALALMPPGQRVSLALGEGARVSFFPLLPSRGTHARGLKWSVEGLDLAPGSAIATSNRAEAALVEAAFDRPGVFVLLERAALPALVEALVPGWKQVARPGMAQA
ncbi:MAG: thiamine diphosphokinase [Pseudomonadota bacterium]